MNPQIDNKYLSLQFWQKIYEKNGSEFQNLFSSVMQKLHPDFVKVRPYGKQGDGGNDGYIPSRGIYYQIYAPENPFDKDAEAAKKMVDDFYKLKESGWEQISNVKEYYFVFNDKNAGLTQVLEAAKTELSNANKDITFGILLPVTIEDDFLTLKSNQLEFLGFDVDQRNSLRISREYLEGLKTELDRGHANTVSQALQKLRSIFLSLEDESLMLDFEILEATTLQRLEQVDAAISRYENIHTRYPKDVRAPLCLAEIYARVGDLEKNQNFLNQVKAIDSSYWLYILQTIIRRIYNREKVAFDSIDINSFPEDSKLKADFYRVYSIFLTQSGDYINARAFIERALNINPDKISYYDPKIVLEVREVSLEHDENKRKIKICKIIDEIDSIENKFEISGDIGNRNKVILAYRKYKLLINNELFEPVFEVENKILSHIFSCYFDNWIDDVLADILTYSTLAKDTFEDIISYLNSSKKILSNTLAKQMFLQFIRQETLHDFGKEFFTNNNLDDFVRLIESIEKKEYTSFVSRVKSDSYFSVLLFNSVRDFDLRKKIFEVLPDNSGIPKDKLKLLLEFDAGNLNLAFDIMRKMDMSDMNYADSVLFIDIAKKKKAWEFVVAFSEKLLSYETRPQEIVKIKSELFNANIRLGRLQQAAMIGHEVLENDQYIKFLNAENSNKLLVLTVKALLTRNTPDDNAIAKAIIETYKHFLVTFESNIWIASEVYLNVEKNPQKALDLIMNAIQIVKRPSPNEYANMCLIFNSIMHLMEFSLDSEEHIIANRFIKFEGEEIWYFIGDQSSIDALPILSDKYNMYYGKSRGDSISFKGRYSTEKDKIVEYILPVEKYIAWQANYYFQKLSSAGLLDGVEHIDIPKNEDGKPEFKNLISVMEDQRKNGQEIFNLYLEKTLPLSILAISEGGFIGAVGRIFDEQLGFIHMSDGSTEEFEYQKEIAKRIIDNKESFYLDGTSAWILSESGILNKLHQYIPNLKIPQSVINLLLEIKQKLEYTPGQSGKISYLNGKIEYVELNIEHQKLIQNRFFEAIRILESDSTRLTYISAASKEGVQSEQRVPASLCDAAILAQKEGVPILTEDFWYLYFNELETNKTRPDYFSSMALVKTLLERGEISFQEYLDFFSYLADYRFRFLQISMDDLLNAVFGDNEIPKPDNLKKLHLSLTLSKDYGVEPLSSMELITGFLLRILVRDEVSTETTVQVFIRIVLDYPTEMDKKQFGQFIIGVLIKIINDNRAKITTSNIQSKIYAWEEANDKLGFNFRDNF